MKIKRSHNRAACRLGEPWEVGGGGVGFREPALVWDSESSVCPAVQKGATIPRDGPSPLLMAASQGTAISFLQQEVQGGWTSGRQAGDV